MKTAIACATALLALGACASTPSPQAGAPEPYYADGAMRTYTVVRDSVLYSAPRPDAPRVGRIYSGDTLSAAYTAVSPDWMRADLANGERVFLFGNPIFPKEQ